MTDQRILLLLHGVGEGDPEEMWQELLSEALGAIGYPDLSDIRVIAPQYPNSLRGVDDNLPLPDVSDCKLRGDRAKQHRRDFERRRTAMESLLGHDDRGSGIPGGDQLAPIVAGLRPFRQADNYVNRPEIRAWVLNRILDRLPDSGRVVIVGHSLGSVIAADLLRRLPPDLKVDGMVTIGSPLAHPTFHLKGLRTVLEQPPANLAWWVNFWSVADPVPSRRGVSAMLPWVLDQRVMVPLGIHLGRAHAAATYLQRPEVARAIGLALFGSLSTDVVLADRAVELGPDYSETLALLALRSAYLTMQRLDGERRIRYSDALRQVEATTFAQIVARNAQVNRPLSTAVASLSVDLADPASEPSEPRPLSHLSIEDSIVPLAVVASQNVLRPFEIDVPEDARRAAIEQLTLQMQLGSRVGRDLLDSIADANKILRGPTNWMKCAALSVGAGAIVGATGGLASVAAPKVASTTAATSALAAFGPGGMIGGLLTAGSIATAGGRSIAAGLAVSSTSAEALEAVVALLLTVALTRRRQGLPRDPMTWNTLVEAEAAVVRELARLRPLSDASSPAVNDLERKLLAIDRALETLRRDLEIEEPVVSQE